MCGPTFCRAVTSSVSPGKCRHTAGARSDRAHGIGASKAADARCSPSGNLRPFAAPVKVHRRFVHAASSAADAGADKCALRAVRGFLADNAPPVRVATPAAGGL